MLASGVNAVIGTVFVAQKFFQVVHLVGQGSLPDDDKAPFQIESGGGSDLARINCSLRHDTAYKPHEVGVRWCLAD